MGSNSVTEPERSHSAATFEEKEMSTEKPPLPPVEIAKTEQQPHQWQGKKILLLVSYGVGVTVLLAACVVFGSILYHIQLKNCSTVQPTATDGQHSDDARGTDSETTAATDNITEKNTHYKTPNGDTVNERVKDDYSSEVETIYYTSEGPENGTILALDYRRSISSLYIPSSEHCYVVAGIDRNFTSPFASQNKNSSEVSGLDKEITVGMNNSYRSYYHVADDYPVRDHSILPSTIRTYCRDREVFWMERGSEADEAVRGKRSYRYRNCRYLYTRRCYMYGRWWWCHYYICWY